MIEILDKIIIDKQRTEKVYKEFPSYEIENTIDWNAYYSKIVNSRNLNKLDLGIDYSKPWEIINNGDFVQIEYLFAGSFKGDQDLTIDDPKIGINFNKELRFGVKEFNTQDIINLTIVI